MLDWEGDELREVPDGEGEINSWEKESAGGEGDEQGREQVI